MKKRNLFLTLGLSLTLGVGVAAGLGASRVEAKETHAATTRIYVKCAQDWWKAKNDKGIAGGVAYHIWGGDGATDWPGTRMTKLENDFDVWYADIDTADCPNVIFVRVPSTGDMADWGAKTADLTFEGNYYTITSTSAVWGNPGVAGEWSNVSEPGYYALINGANKTALQPHKGNELKLEITAKAGDVISFTHDGAPYAATGQNTYHNNVTASLEVKYDGTFFIYLDTSNSTVFAAGYQEQSSYIYYVSNEKYDTTNKIYASGGARQFGDGTAIMSVEGVKKLSTVINFNGHEGYIYKIPVKNTDNKFIFKNADGSVETAEKNLEFRKAFWWDDTATGDADAALALDLLDEVEDARNAVTHYGTADQNWSICGIAAATAGSLWNKYFALGTEAKAYVDASTTYTWKDASSNDQQTNQKNWNFSDIMLQLKAIAQLGSIPVNGSAIAISTNNGNNSVIVVSVILTSIAFVSIISFFVIRRRKEQE